MKNEYDRHIMVWDDRGYRPATPAEVEAVRLANGKLSVSCVEGHLMTEDNTYRATIGGYPRRFCRTCKRARKAGDKSWARVLHQREAERVAEAAAERGVRRLFKREAARHGWTGTTLHEMFAELPPRTIASDGRQESSVAYLARLEAHLERTEVTA